MTGVNAILSAFYIYPFIHPAVSLAHKFYLTYKLLIEKDS